MNGAMTPAHRFLNPKGLGNMTKNTVYELKKTFKIFSIDHIQGTNIITLYFPFLHSLALFQMKFQKKKKKTLSIQPPIKTHRK